MRAIDELNPLNFINVEEYDEIKINFLVVGTGIAGLRAAYEIAKNDEVLIITKSEMIETNTNYAQGGIAVVLSHEDEFNLHIEDTIYAGAGLCDYAPVEILVKEGPQRIYELIEMDTKFDKKEDGKLSLTKEAAHSRNRILHAGDTTGAEIERALSETIKKNKNIKIMEHIILVSFINNNNVLTYDLKNNKYIIITFKAIVLATGSIGQVYEHTSNPDVATGDGIALAYHFGLKISDMEFVQFHPTTFYKKDAPRFLISESLRGEGGILRNKFGEAFMYKYHERKELAPRDIVSRSILNEINITKSECVYLDMTSLSREYLYSRFPNITKFCMDYNIDIAKDYIPVSPAAHYSMGGIFVDVFGKTNKKCIYAAGEVAMTGVHGANRLASNSLLEGLVFGKRAGETAYKDNKDLKVEKCKYDFKLNFTKEILTDEINNIKMNVQKIMWKNVGIIREKKELEETKRKIEKYSEEIRGKYFNKANIKIGVEMLNILTVAYIITVSALERKESRGAHYRKDYPFTKDEYKKHTYFEK